MSIRVEFYTASWISLNFKWINNGKRKSIFVKLLAEACASSDDLSVFTFSLDAVRPSFFDIDNHISWVKFIYVEIKELVNELCHTLCVFFLWHVKLLNDLEILFEERICLIHAIDFLVDVLCRIIMASPFWIQFFDRYWIVDRLLSLISKKSFLKARKNWGLCVL